MSLDQPMTTATHLVAHLLREIESALRDVLEPLEERSEHASIGDVSAINKHKSEIRSILKALEIAENDPVAKAWLCLPGKSNDYGLAARAHRDALAEPRPIGLQFRQFWAEMEAVLDVVLEKFESRYLLFLRRLDELLAKTVPTQTDARILRSQIPNNLVALGYFFERLSTTAWLEPLKAEGFFKHPPEPERDEERGLIHFPPWPESRYLARIASQDPAAVLEIALEVPDTRNILVHTDLLNAALGMPSEHAARLVDKAKAWIESPYPSLIPDKVGSLVAHLARGHQVDKALELGQSLLALKPCDRPVPEIREHERLPTPPEPQAWFDEWDYRQILERHIPALVIAAGQRALNLLCDILDAAVSFSRGDTEGDGPEDYSYIWRPAIEDHTQNQQRGIDDALVTAVRDAAAQIARSDPGSIPTLVQNLEKRRWQVFHRLALHLISEFPDQAPELAAERLGDRKRFDDAGLHHEYAVLAQKCFAALPEEDKRKILNWVDEGPDLAGYKSSREERTGRRLKDEDVERYGRLWRRDQLALFSGNLPPEWARQYEELVAEFGVAEHPEFVVYSSAAWASTPSILGPEEIQAMGVQEIVSFMKSWQPSGGFMSPSSEDLGRELTAAVASDPKRFAVEAGLFRGLHPDYVSGLICGLRDAARAKNSFPWRPVLNLCHWVVDQSDGVSDEERAQLGQQWRWSRELIADLLSYGISESTIEIPFELRSMVWEILEPLTEDPDPTPDTEAAYTGSIAGFYGLSINSTRGQAMHAVVRYALSVRKHIEQQATDKEEIARGFQIMPKVQAVLDHHLDTEHDPARSIRAVYGRFFPWLVLLDPDWAVASVARIFPTAQTERDLRDAAWETYITTCPAYDNVFDVLTEEYSRAVDYINEQSKESRPHPDPDERLGEHLMALYWRGKLNLDEPEGILERFYSKAPDTLRGDALKFIGISTGHTEGAVAPQIVERLEALWARRLDAGRRAAGAGRHSTELAAFGWWFISAKFDDVWAISQLREALRIADRTEPDHLVVERLAMLAPTLPLPVVECLSLMIDGDVEGWHIDLWREHIRSILGTVIQSSDRTARHTSVSLIHRLAARGYLAFRDLLPEGN